LPYSESGAIQIRILKAVNGMATRETQSDYVLLAALDIFSKIAFRLGLV
jgi:hypothetical protein